MSAPRRPAGGFEPRLGAQPSKAPFYPGSYYLVAFFGGIIALAYIAITNLGRISPVKDTGLKTAVILVVAGAVSLGYLLVAPADWWTPIRELRLGLRVIAVVASGALYLVHRGPAFGAHARFGEYHSMWKAIVPIIGATVAQLAATALVGYARGVL